MSGEYYILEEIIDPPESDPDVNYSRGDVKSGQGNTSKSKKESKLHEIEQQLKLAENRCTCLKNQLDYMKQLYGNKKGEIKCNKNESSRIHALKRHYETSLTEKEQNITSRTTQTNLNEEVNTTKEDITKSSGTTANLKKLKPTELKNNLTVKVPKQNINTINEKENKITVSIPKTDNKQSTSEVMKSNKQNERKTRPSSRGTKRRKTAPSYNRNNKVHSITPKISDLSAHKLVEIYHNQAAKDSESDDSNGEKKSKCNELKSITENKVPPLKINVQCQNEGQINRQVSSQQATELYDITSNIVPQDGCNIYYKGYALPTIASRMKQVAKNYLSTYSFKTIPFCAAISTTPSHNIGINIQQVMNIIKNRHPVQGLSPTLTHNIVLAANKLNCTPLNTIISSITSRADYGTGKHQCPLSRSLMNYHQLEEMAKTIPDDVINEDDEDVDNDSPDIETNIITGPTGEFKVQNQKKLLWSMQTTNNTCTCIPQSGLEFGQVVTKYQSNHTIYTNSRISNSSTRRTLKKPLVKSNSKFKTVKSQNSKLKIMSEHMIANDKQTPLQGKERNLKEVLTNLYDDFDALNKKYEKVAAKVNADENSENKEEYLKELGKLENDLSNKEEEITMVMALYKEVLALKDQIKVLRKQSSKPAIRSKDDISKFTEYNNPKAAFHLTKLLKQIQHCQLHYKKGGCL